MCNICEKKQLLNTEYAKVSIEENKLKLDYDAYSTDSSFIEYIEIKYCMMCGKKLQATKSPTN